MYAIHIHALQQFRKKQETLKNIRYAIVVVRYRNIKLVFIKKQANNENPNNIHVQTHH